MNKVNCLTYCFAGICLPLLLGYYSICILPSKCEFCGTEVILANERWRFQLNCFLVYVFVLFTQLREAAYMGCFVSVWFVDTIALDVVIQILEVNIITGRALAKPKNVRGGSWGARARGGASALCHGLQRWFMKHSVIILPSSFVCHSLLVKPRREIFRPRHHRAGVKYVFLLFVLAIVALKQ